MSPRLAKVGITLGDPAGVGPEILAASLASLDEAQRARLVVFGDRGVLARAGRSRGLEPSAVEIEEVTALAPGEAQPGRPDAASARAQVAYLEAGAAAAVAARVGALVTAPIHKLHARSAGFSFPGHTEFLAERSGAVEHAMAFYGPRLRVALVTTHVPLARVSSLLTPEAIARTLFLLGRALRDDFGLGQPRLAVAGLNPHAGEGGLLGEEEASVVVPGIEQGRARLASSGIAARVEGPAVPDVVFRQAADGAWDGVIAMYHDQGLIPVKLLELDAAVNVTLGLPFVRTSPDHGVAYDAAGRGAARPQSFQAALALAFRLLDRRARIG